LLIISAHLTPLAFTNKLKGKESWQGIFPPLFAGSSEALIYSKRHDWKRLALLLNSVAKPGDKIIFKRCDACWEFPLIFYDLNIKGKFQIERTSNIKDCSDWIVSTTQLKYDEESCGLTYIGMLNRFYIYGRIPITLSHPIQWSKHLYH